MALSASDMMNMTQQEAQGAVQTEVAAGAANAEQIILMNRINESRRQGLELSNPIIENINSNTERIITGLTADKF